MKSLLIIAATLALSTSAFASQIRVVCSVDGSNTYVQVLKNDQSPAEVSLFSNAKEIVRVSGADVFELSSDLHRLNVFASHHNTTMKLATDFDLFGGNLQTEGEETWNGYLYVSPKLESETGHRSVSPVRCNYDI